MVFSISSTEELFTGIPDTKDDANELLFKLRMNNLQMLSWVYLQMGLAIESAKVQHDILYLELERGLRNPIDWGLRSARISVLCLSKSLFRRARYSNMSDVSP